MCARPHTHANVHLCTCNKSRVATVKQFPKANSYFLYSDVNMAIPPSNLVTSETVYCDTSACWGKIDQIHSNSNSNSTECKGRVKR